MKFDYNSAINPQQILKPLVRNATFAIAEVTKVAL